MKKKISSEYQGLWAKCVDNVYTTEYYKIKTDLVVGGLYKVKNVLFGYKVDLLNHMVSYDLGHFDFYLDGELHNIYNDPKYRFIL